MAEFPFKLVLKHVSSNNEEESLSCTALLRVIPGRRRVYDALWNDKNVIAKVFSHKISARRHLRREWQGLSKLQEYGLSSPKPLFYGQAKDGQWAVVVQKICDSSTVLDVLEKTQDTAKKLDLLILVCKELARQHIKGVLQRDFHLGNFLMTGDRVFALDPGQMRFLSREVARRKGISQLALLVRYLPTSDVASAATICEEYFEARGWHFGKSDEALLQKQLTAHRKKGIRKGLKKCLRTSKRSLRVKADKYHAVFDKRFCLGAKPLDFIKQINALMDAGEILKDGNTCYVSHLTWNDRDVVVKRYNHKGFVHSLRHSIKRSRARRGWLHAHRLGMLGIATPRPLAYVEQRKGLLVWQSYLVTEYVGGRRLYDFLRDDKLTEQQRSEVAEQVRELLEKLKEHCISHGDLKHSNILIADRGPTLLDLDSMRVHRWNWTHELRWVKDMRGIGDL